MLSCLFAPLRCCYGVVWAGVFAAVFSTIVHAERYALLIGVGQYQDTTVAGLQGPANDVAVIKQLLMNDWGFTASNIMTLVDAAATRANIMAALQAMPERTRAGDQVLLYLSGHGTSARDPNVGQLAQLLPDGSGAFLPYDFPARAEPALQQQQLLIGRRDLRPVLSALDQQNRQVFVVVDSCYSGNTVRALRSAVAQPPLPVRYWRAVSDRAFDADLVDAFAGTQQPQPASQTDVYPYNNIVFLAAASESEAAQDIRRQDLVYYPTRSNRPHGAFSDALIRVLSGSVEADRDRNGLSYAELYSGVKEFMAQRQYRHTPRLLPELHQDPQQLAERKTLGQQVSPQHSSSLRIQLEPGLRQLRRQLQAISGIQFVTAQADLQLLTTDNGLLLVNGVGDLIGQYADSSILQTYLQQLLWLRQVQDAARQHAAAFNLRLELRGGGVVLVEGSELHIDVQSDRDMQLLLFNLNAQGEIYLLYPQQASELQLIPAYQPLSFPGELGKIIIQKPFGSDQLIAIGFTRPVALMDQLARQTVVSAHDPVLNQLLQLLQQGTTEYQLTSQALITIARP